MFTRLITLLSIFAILIQFPAVVAASSSPVLAITEKPKPCPACQASPPINGVERLDLLSTLGRRTQVSPFLPLRRSSFDGLDINLVNTATGSLSFALTDISAGGAVPIMFQRTYISSRQEDFGLGAGWSYAFVDRIEISGNNATFTDATGTRLFRRDGQSNRFISSTVDANLHQQFELTDPNTLVERDSSLDRLYEKTGKYYVLTQMRGAQGINISIDHDERGNPTRIANTPGAALTLEWVGIKQPRLMSVSDNAGHRVTFGLEGRALRSFSDPTGAQWTYDYSGGLLRRVVDPVGRVLLRARYDRDNHTIEAGDDISVNRYEFQWSSTNISARTTVTDALGAVTTYEHNDRGALLAIRDDEGKSLNFEYTAANRVARIWDSANEVRFAYDGQNRLLSQATNGNVEGAYKYGVDGKPSSITEGTERTELTLDGRGQILSSQSSDPARSYTARYNQMGQLISLRSDAREVSFAYDSDGNRTSVNYSDGKRYGFQYDAAGHLISRQFPSGLALVDERDARGALITERDNRGNSITVEYDAGGSPAAYTRADGTRISVVRDAIGRVISLTGFDGKERHFNYDNRGALTDYTDTRGNHRKYKYDHRGRLQSIVYDAGVTTKIERDERGHIRRLTSERTPSNGNNPSSLESRMARRWAHVTVFQDDPPLPPPDEPLDVVVTNIWEPYYNVYGGGGFRHPALQAADGEGGTSTRDIDCASAVIACLMLVATYPSLVGGLILACPETFGLTCFGALVALVGVPVLGILQCSKAYHICGLG